MGEECRGKGKRGRHRVHRFVDVRISLCGLDEIVSCGGAEAREHFAISCRASQFEAEHSSTSGAERSAHDYWQQPGGLKISVDGFSRRSRETDRDLQRIRPSLSRCREAHSAARITDRRGAINRVQATSNGREIDVPNVFVIRVSNQSGVRILI